MKFLCVACDKHVAELCNCKFASCHPRDGRVVRGMCRVCAVEIIEAVV